MRSTRPGNSSSGGRQATHQQKLSESKLQRILEYSQRLQQQLEMPRIPVSQAAQGLIEYCNKTYDPLVPSVWGSVHPENDPFAPSRKKMRCCSLM
ncbi:GGL domain-containing protein [Dichotomocladium elegans]|nr:GGL domain-containing protein [Dichotomocladium elegans]